MTMIADAPSKRSVARLRRLLPMLEGRVSDAAAALELLITEAEGGELRPDLWEKLHAAVQRDDKELGLASAYEQLLRGRRLKSIAPPIQADVLLHAADFMAGIIGDVDAASGFLKRILEIVPDHREAFDRLERYFTGAHRDRELAELYAHAVSARSEPQILLIGRALALIERMPATEQLSLESCERLVRAAPANSRAQKVLEAHCRGAGRHADLARLLELAIETNAVSPAEILDARVRVVALYLGELKAPESALPHVVEILQTHPGHAEGRRAAERMLTHPTVASRAAAALHEARKRGATERPAGG